jgi:hypothetical protein
MIGEIRIGKFFLNCFYILVKAAKKASNFRAFFIAEGVDSHEALARDPKNDPNKKGVLMSLQKASAVCRSR